MCVEGGWGICNLQTNNSDPGQQRQKRRFQSSQENIERGIPDDTREEWKSLGEEVNLLNRKDGRQRIQAMTVEESRKRNSKG